METYTIKDLKERGIPSRTLISGMFYDWFCKDSSLGRRGEICLKRLKTLVKKCPGKFNDEYVIDFKNCCPSFGRTYDCVRVWDSEANFKYAFVPNETKGGCSYIEGSGGEIVNFSNWNELKTAFAA